MVSAEDAARRNRAMSFGFMCPRMFSCDSLD
jgi:hypothetical protein